MNWYAYCTQYHQISVEMWLTVNPTSFLSYGLTPVSLMNTCYIAYTHTSTGNLRHVHCINKFGICEGGSVQLARHFKLQFDKIANISH